MVADVWSVHLFYSDRLKTLKVGGQESNRDRRRKGEKERGRVGGKTGTEWLSQEKGEVFLQKEKREGRKERKSERLHVAIWGSRWVMDRDRIAGKFLLFLYFFCSFTAEEATSQTYESLALDAFLFVIYFLYILFILWWGSCPETCVCVSVYPPLSLCDSMGSRSYSWLALKSPRIFLGDTVS